MKARTIGNFDVWLVDGLRYGFGGLLVRYRQKGTRETYVGQQANDASTLVDRNGFPQPYSSKETAWRAARARLVPVVDALPSAQEIQSEVKKANAISRTAKR